MGVRAGCLMLYLFVCCNGRHLENPNSTVMQLLCRSCYYIISVKICMVLRASCVPHRNKDKVSTLKNLQINISTELNRLVVCKLQGQALKKKTKKMIWRNVVPNGIQWNCKTVAIKHLICYFCYFYIDFLNYLVLFQFYKPHPSCTTMKWWY